MKKIHKSHVKSINVINYLLVILLISVNFFFYLYDSFNNLISVYLSLNAMIFILFYIVNKEYKKENDLNRRNIKTLNEAILSGKNTEIKDLLLKKSTFKENEDTFRAVKDMYLKKNLIAKDYKDLTHIFQKLVPEKMLVEVGEKGREQISLGLSVKKELTIMFIDIIGFTSMSEKISSDKTLFLLNIYFDGIVEIIKENGGYVDKFLGDGMMVVFDDGCSDKAIKTAIEIQNFMNKIQISDFGRKISIGIGVNTGEVILGTIGSSKRMEITIVGDVVNTASRIEGISRNYKDNILISNNTYKSIKRKEDFSINDLGITSLKGKKSKIRIYGVEPIIKLDL